MRFSNRRNLGCVSSAQRQLCCLVRLRGRWGKVGAHNKEANLFTKVTILYRSYCRQHLMTHALWLTLSPTADNGGFHSLQPTSASQSRVQKGAYGGVQKLFIAGVHSWGLFPLMVKTFCSGSNQAHCRDSTFYIHEMRAKDGKESETERMKEEGEEENREEGLNIPLPPLPPIMLEGASSSHRKWSYQPWVEGCGSMKQQISEELSNPLYKTWEGVSESRAQGFGDSVLSQNKSFIHVFGNGDLIVRVFKLIWMTEMFLETMIASGYLPHIRVTRDTLKQLDFLEYFE